MFAFFKSKPFYKNKTREEFIDWFAKAQNWNKLNSKIINILIDKFIDDPLAFEVFVYTSETCNLISNNYIPLSEDSSQDMEFLLSTFALTLYNTGALFRDQLIEKINEVSQKTKELSRLLNLAQSSFESAAKLDEFCFGTYYQLAFLKGALLNKYKQGIEYCNQGLAKIKKLESINQDKLSHMQRASFDSIEENKNLFNEAIKEYEEKKNASKSLSDELKKE